MNTVTLMGQLLGQPELVFTSNINEKKLYKLVLKVQKPTKKGDNDIDFINIKVWSNILGNEQEYFEDTLLGVEGKLTSYVNQEKTKFINEIIATKVVNYN